MIVRPMIGDWPVPHIERIAAHERRRLARLPVPGLAGDLHHDLGLESVLVEIEGSVHGDQAREELLAALRAPFLAGEPVTFVADITTATEIEEVVIEALDVEEASLRPDCRFRIRLRQYVEPPEPPTPIDDLGGGLDAELDALADLGLEALELPGLAAGVPDVADPTPPIREALEGVRAAVAPLGELLSGLGERLA